MYIIQHEEKVSGNSGMEWWNGLYWNGILEWTGTRSLSLHACNLKRYMDQVDRYYLINYASTTLGTADHVGLTFISYNP